ncbi:MAG: 3-hydroxybutyryl-CoA dehydrogenase [Myxococcota bacterium]|nr:3-hydroxybutyryl-CoA dehydrogenase [Myxococcota bacterium]
MSEREMDRSLRSIGVLGAGQMGAGIAQVAASVGFLVKLGDVNLERASVGRAGIGRRLGRAVSKGKLSQQEADLAVARISPVGSIEGLADCDIVIEAASEDEGLKLKLFQTLDQHCKAEAILATNTSSIPITRIAAATRRPEQVIGMHFMNPVPVMKLVELIRGIATSDATYQATAGLAEAMGKTTVLSRDMPGFIVNRVLMPMINEAVYALYEGIASVEDIDEGMKLGTNQPMGPLTLADFIGLDTCLAIMEVLHQGFGDSKYRPCPLLRQYVEAGWVGRKSGRGFYQY